RHLVQPRSQKTAQRQRVRRPPCDATLAVDAFKIPDEQQTEVPPRRQTRPPHSLRVEPGALLFHPFVKAALFQQSVQLFVKRMRYRPRQVCLCDPNRLLSSLPRFSAHCHARSLLPTVVNHSTIYDENPDLHHGLLGKITIRGSFTRRRNANPGTPFSRRRKAASIFPFERPSASSGEYWLDIITSTLGSSSRKIFRASGIHVSSCPVRKPITKHGFAG